MTLPELHLAYFLLGVVVLVASPIDSSKALSVCPSPCSCLDDPDVQPSHPSLVVDCRQQGLTTLPPFDCLHGIPIFRLFLDQNELTVLPGHAFNNLTMHGVDLSGNPIANISKEAFAGTFQLRYLSLRRTELITPIHTFITPLWELQAFDLAEIKTSIFMRLPRGAFGYLPALEQLLLQQNRITQIDPSAFSGLPVLFELHLEANKLTAIPNALQTVTTLQGLHLDGNPIERVSAGALSRLIKLKTLTLTDTRLTSETLEEGVLSGAGSSLRKLDLSVNDLGAAPCHMLHELPELRELLLADTMVAELPAGCFKLLSKLHLLDLSGNTASVTGDVLAGLQSTMEVLRLERLGLTMETLPLKALQQMTRLRVLSLSGNIFPTLPKRAFAGLTIGNLSLKYCGVRSVHVEAFEELKAPFTLHLNNNRIQNLTFLSNKCQFEHVELFQNPVTCDCTFYHVLRYGITTFLGQCAAPPTYAGVKLNDFKSNENVTSVCGMLSGVSDSILCSWQYLKPDHGSVMRASLLTMIGSVLFAQTIHFNYY